MDNQQILEALDDIVTFREEPTSEQIEALIEAIDIVEKYSKIGGWIPCSERLPDAKNNVLICQNDGYVSVGYYSQEKFLDLYSYPFNEVIAWQPLPEAYNG